MPDLVSVVIPTHNYAHFLGDAIESALSQGFEPIEIIVIDDGSTDETPAVLRRFEGIVQVIRLDGRGVAEARNAGLARASGAYVVFLDADDLLVSGGVCAQAGFLDRHPEADAVYGPWYTYDMRTGASALVVSPIKPDRVYPQILLGNVVTTPSAMMLRRRVLGAEGGFNPAVSFTADWELWLRLAARGHRFGAVSHPVAIYRIHERSMTRDLNRAARDVWYTLDTFYDNSMLAPEAAGLKSQAYFRMGEYLAKLYLEHGDEAEARRLLQRALALAPEAADSTNFYDGIARAMWRRWQLDGSPQVGGATQAAVRFAAGLGASAESLPGSRLAVVHLAAGLAARRLDDHRIARYHLWAALRASWRTVATWRHLPTLARLCVPRQVTTTVKKGMRHLGWGAVPGADHPQVTTMMASSKVPDTGSIARSHGHSRS